MTAIRRPVIIDCDPGVDDAIALLLALNAPELEVLGISVVSGNLPLERTLRTALQVRELAGRTDVPVFAGCRGPLVRAPIHGLFHGKGLGPVELPEPATRAEAQHAVQFLVEHCTAAARAGQALTLCTCGPLTNVAMALRMAPDMAAGIARIVMMGGAFQQAGNRTMAAEFNMLADPHAAHIVFSSDIPITVLSLDASHQAITTPERVAAIGANAGNVSAVIAEVLKHWDRKDPRRFGGPGGPLHDPLVIAWLLKPEFFTTRPARVFVEHVSELTMGQTIADWWNKSGQPANAEIVERVDADGFFALVAERLGAYGS